MLLVLLATFGFAGCNNELGTLDVASARLMQFGSCSDVEGHFKQEARSVAQHMAASSLYDPFGYLAQGSSADINYSTTNNQEEGIHEADLFQVDATHAFAIDGDRLIIIEAVQQQSGVAMQINDARIVSQVALRGEAVEMFLSGNQVVIVQRVKHQSVALQYSASSVPSRDPQLEMVMAVIYDVSDRSLPLLVREVAVEGEYISGRRIDDELHLVTRSAMGGPRPEQDKEVNLSELMAQVETAQLDDWFPHVYSRSFAVGVKVNESVARSDCARTFAAQSGGGDDAIGIYSIDLSKQDSRVQTTTFIGDGSIVYGSRNSIVVAQTNYADATYTDGSVENVQATQLHRFALADGRATYAGSGLVHGWVLNQFSISEHRGYLRVGTQMNRGEFDSRSMIFTMPVSAPPSDQDVMMGTEVPTLQVAGQLTDIGVREDLYAVRFMGDVAYLVTFQQVDPLHTIDLSNPANPVEMGELEVPGYSTYLHPIDNGRLLAVGTDTDVNGVKLSMFDVSRLTDPTALVERTIGSSGSSSEVAIDHRAFRYLPDWRLMALPVDEGGRKGMHLFEVGASSFTERGVIDHAQLLGVPGADARRAYHIGSYLYVYSGAGVTISDLRNLELRASVKF
jgi:uncharacterized secreted protein with C-terminal beta-propeller domain